MRWAKPIDIPAFTEIEELCFAYPWSAAEFKAHMKFRGCVSMAAEVDGKVIGYLIYQLSPSRISICNLAVAPEFQRHGYGRQMIEWLKRKLTGRTGRRLVTADLRERNVCGCIFFRAVGFRCVNIFHGFYDETDESAYHFHFKVKPNPNAALTVPTSEDLIPEVEVESDGQ